MSEPCRNKHRVSLQGQVHFPVYCTLPAGHEFPWHEYAAEDGTVHYVWLDVDWERDAYGAYFPYQSLHALETGPHQTEKLGRHV